MVLHRLLLRLLDINVRIGSLRRRFVTTQLVLAARTYLSRIEESAARTLLLSVCAGCRRVERTVPCKEPTHSQRCQESGDISMPNCLSVKALCQGKSALTYVPNLLW